MRKIYKLSLLKSFAVCPHRYKLISENSISELNSIGDPDLLLGAALKEAYLKYSSKVASTNYVRHTSIISGFSESWIKYQKIYKDLDLNNSIPVDKLTNGYNALHKYKDLFVQGTDIAAINMPYTKVLGNFEIEDYIDLILVKPIKHRSKKTFVQLLILDEDIQIPSRTNFITRVRAVMQEIFIRRELVSQDAQIDTSILNLYHNKLFSVSLTQEHRTNYRRYLKSIVRSIEAGVDHPNPSKSVCKKCAVQSLCHWSSKS